MKYSVLVLAGLFVSVVSGCSSAPNGDETAAVSTTGDQVASRSSQANSSAPAERREDDFGALEKVQADFAKLKPGDMAPVFDLASLDGKTQTDLADLVGKKPVLLIFGSYT